MATTLYFRLAGPTNYDHSFKDQNKVGTASYWSTRGLSTTQGTAVQTATATSVAGPTSGIEAGGNVEYISEPVAADVTISGTMSFNLYGLENNMSANAAIACMVQRINHKTGTLDTIIDGKDDAELNTSAGEMTWTGTPTSTAVKKGDRFRAVVYFDDAASNMGASYTLTFRYAHDDTNTGDSWFSFNETVTFQTFTGVQYIYPTNTASDLSTADIDYKAWTSRGT